MTEQSMIERVARAIEDTPEFPEPKSYRIRVARAAIEAMREPTLEMQNAIWREVGQQGCSIEIIEVAPLHRAAIDAALSNEGR